jgi:hypothetical protein
MNMTELNLPQGHRMMPTFQRKGANVCLPPMESPYVFPNGCALRIELWMVLWVGEGMYFRGQFCFFIAFSPHGH